MSRGDIAVSVRGLSRSYTIAHNAQKHTTLGEALAHRLKNPLQRVEKETFWALKDVSFDIRKGDVVGIIGRNGAGKSTLLKILSRITKPTSGEVRLYGRVGSLLEVGTGFHPELTGRENIYLNGAILGMRKREIDRHFDAIVDFAEVELFLDTPVKRYSSGMYVRLAFAVAAHLNPEILVVDEVLAVGDAEFQKKCLGKMSEVAGGGRTVLFVSHNMGSVAALCRSAILLSAGRIVHAGPVDRAIDSYTGSPTGRTRIEYTADSNKPSITAVQIDNDALQSGHISINIEFQSPYPLRRPIGGIVISDATGLPIWGTNGRFHLAQTDHGPAATGKLVCKCEDIPLAPSFYSISIWLGDWNRDFDYKRDVLSFQFRPWCTGGLRPHPATIGYLDWPAIWELQVTSG